MMRKEIAIGSVVKSVSGRDNEKVYVVVDKQSKYLSLANGKDRKIGNAKRKNILHVSCLGEIKDIKLTNDNIIKILKNY